MVDELDLPGIYGVYERDERGQPPYDPRMMTKLLVYAYCVRVYSARKIAQRALEARAQGRAKKQGQSEEEAAKAKPEGKGQYNFTDPESRTMKGGATKEFVQAYRARRWWPSRRGR